MVVKSDGTIRCSNCMSVTPKGHSLLEGYGSAVFCSTDCQNEYENEAPVPEEDDEENDTRRYF